MQNQKTSEVKKQLYDVIVPAAAFLNISQVVCDTPHGKYMVDIRDREIGGSIIVHGEFEYQEKCGWFDYVAGGTNKLFIDIGANIGTSAIPLLLDNRIGQALVFEPDPNNLFMLDYNRRCNGLYERMYIEPVAISNFRGTARFELSVNNFGDHRVRYRDLPSGSYGESARQLIEVPCITLDEVLRSKNVDLAKIALIKSDTQGSEGQVLEGARDVLEARIPWVIEFWPYGIDRSGFDRNKLIAIVSGAFSRFIEFKPGMSPQFRPIAEFSNLFAEYGGTAFANLMLLP